MHKELSYRLMGIVNLTDNSFVSGSRMLDRSIDSLCRKVGKMVSDGAEIIDIGACSSAPGNSPVTMEEELSRLALPLKELFAAFPDVEFSIDTVHPFIVQELLSYGKPFIVNDINASAMKEEMLKTVVENHLCYIAMDSSDSPLEFFNSFARKADEAGLKDWILDPGFGFGKTLERNWEILDNLGELKVFGKQILIGMSRKRMIWQKYGLNPETCAKESVAAEKLAAIKGGDIIRTHDLELHG